MSLVIYHGACDDGFASAYAIWKHYPHWEFFPGVYQQDPPVVLGRDVYFVDFSYKRPVMDELILKARTVTIWDHHKTARDDLQPLLDNRSLLGHFDLHHCGAFITWEQMNFETQLPMPDWFHYIEDRDLWKKELPHTDEVTMAIRSYPQNFTVWDSFKLPALIEEGRTIHRYYRLRVEEAKKLVMFDIWKEGSVALVNANYSLASEVAGELCQEHNVDFGACWYMNSDGTKTYSLRSRGEFDVSEVAKARGGGGHKNAAGFRTQGPATMYRLLNKEPP